MKLKDLKGIKLKADFKVDISLNNNEGYEELGGITFEKIPEELLNYDIEGIYADEIGSLMIFLKEE